MINYSEIDAQELKSRILDAKAKYGKRLIVLGHYYQQDDVIGCADREGDSFELAKIGAESDAEYIIFCGVRFMAESSAILAKPGQRVFLPDLEAGCPLADMADLEQVERAWKALAAASIDNQFIPVAYMNSSAEIKGFCGRLGGIICTSSSAAKAFAWAAAQGKKIFFMPDENLGRNTAASMGMSDGEILQWNPFGDRFPDSETLAKTRMIVWKGHCHVHTFFTRDHIAAVRAKLDGCRVIVHPECSPEVVALSDANGSTAFIKRSVEDAPTGARIAIGTEINLVARLARKHADKMIVPLARSLCPNMFKTSLADLCSVIERLDIANEIRVPEGSAKDARVALNRMLEL